MCSGCLKIVCVGKPLFGEVKGPRGFEFVHLALLLASITLYYVTFRMVVLVGHTIQYRDAEDRLVYRGKIYSAPT